MNKKVFAVVMVLSLPVLLFSQASSVTYLNGFSYTNTILYGDTSWDHMDQFNMLTGIAISRPLEEKPQYSSRIRVAFNQPLWGRVRQLDGDSVIIQTPDVFPHYGFNCFAGLEMPMDWGRSLFSTTVQIGPVMDIQTLSDSMIYTLGAESGLDAQFGLRENWLFVMGFSLYYNFWGIHTVGEAARYEVNIKRGWGMMIRPGFRYSY